MCILFNLHDESRTTSGEAMPFGHEQKTIKTQRDYDSHRSISSHGYAPTTLTPLTASCCNESAHDSDSTRTHGSTEVRPRRHDHTNIWTGQTRVRTTTSLSCEQREQTAPERAIQHAKITPPPAGSACTLPRSDGGRGSSGGAPRYTPH